MGTKTRSLFVDCFVTSSLFVRFNVSRTGARGGILGDESERLKRWWDVPAFFFRIDATEETEDSVEEDDTLP